MIKQVLIFMVSITMSQQLLQAQDSLRNKNMPVETLINNNIESKHFTFVASSLTPMRGNFKQLTDRYDVTVQHDSLICHLPYFGQAHVAPLDPSNISYDFISTRFEYTVTIRKKGGWNILIKPSDQNKINYLSFTIFSNGTAYLDINSFDRDPISYRGYLEGVQ